jgi:hypothetical protein
LIIFKKADSALLNILLRHFTHQHRSFLTPVSTLPRMINAEQLS